MKCLPPTYTTDDYIIIAPSFYRQFSRCDNDNLTSIKLMFVNGT